MKQISVEVFWLDASSAPWLSEYTISAECDRILVDNVDFLRAQAHEQVLGFAGDMQVKAEHASTQPSALRGRLE